MEGRRRVAVVTGGGRGIGRAVALALARDGADVAVDYRRDDVSAHDTVTAIEALGRQARAYRASVDSFDQDQVMVEAVLAEFGTIDILVNNAGIASRGRRITDTDPAEVGRVIGTHAVGAHYLCQ